MEAKGWIWTDVYRCRIESESELSMESVGWLFLLKGGGYIVITWWKKPSLKRMHLFVRNIILEEFTRYQNDQDLQWGSSAKTQKLWGLMHFDVIWMLWKGGCLICKGCLSINRWTEILRQLHYMQNLLYKIFEPTHIYINLNYIQVYSLLIYKIYFNHLSMSRNFMILCVILFPIVCFAL